MYTQHRSWTALPSVLDDFRKTAKLCCFNATAFSCNALNICTNFAVHTFAPHACSNDKADGPKSGGLAAMEADR